MYTLSSSLMLFANCDLNICRDDTPRPRMSSTLPTSTRLTLYMCLQTQTLPHMECCHNTVQSIIQQPNHQLFTSVLQHQNTHYKIQEHIQTINPWPMHFIHCYYTLSISLSACRIAQFLNVFRLFVPCVVLHCLHCSELWYPSG